jgi:hypothetical protein
MGVAMISFGDAWYFANVDPRHVMRWLLYIGDEQLITKVLNEIILLWINAGRELVESNSHSEVCILREANINRVKHVIDRVRNAFE